MRRILTTRRAEWLPGIAILGAAAGIGALLGLNLGRGAWLFDAAFVAGVLVAAGVWRWRRAGSAEPTGKPRGRNRILPSGKPVPRDLANDESTKDQRYLM